MTITTIKTLDQHLAEMLTENTGISMLDSGGENGRSWQRNAGKTVADFIAQPSAEWERDYGITLDVFHFLRDHLKVSDMTERMNAFYKQYLDANDDDGDAFWNPEIVIENQYFSELTGFFVDPATVQKENLYNTDHLLSQGFLFTDFSDDEGDVWYTALSIHGGADIRGGYTEPRFFEVCCKYWACHAEDANAHCETCQLTLNRRGWDTECWDDVNCHEYDLPEHGYHVEDGCPKCGGDLKASAMDGECY